MLCTGARKRQLFLAFLMFGDFFWFCFCLGFFFPFPGGWDLGLLPYLFVCLSHVVFLRELQRPVAHSQLLGTEVVPCIILTLHARVFMLE